jgi:hypothetical protein
MLGSCGVESGRNCGFVVTLLVIIGLLKLADVLHRAHSSSRWQTRFAHRKPKVRSGEMDERFKIVSEQTLTARETRRSFGDCV